MCSPRSGGGRRGAAACPSILIGDPTWRIIPSSACLIAASMPRARDCGASIAARMSFTGPHGTSAASRAPSQCAAGRPASRAATIGISASRATTRSSFVRNRESAARCGNPTASQNRGHWRSLPTATTIGTSAVSKTWYGTMFGCALPLRVGDRPVAKAF